MLHAVPFLARAANRGLRSVLVVAIAVLLSTQASIGQSTLVYPPGTLVTGTVYQHDGTSVPSVTTGADANQLIHASPPTLSFVPNDPASVVLTTSTTTYVRVFTLGTTNQIGSFIAPANA